MARLAELFEDLRTGADYSYRIKCLFACNVVLVLWARYVVLQLAPGRQRLLAVVPAIALQCGLPLLFSAQSEIITTVAVAFLYVWLANFKLLGLALDRGPLALDLSLPQFSALLLGPITPQHDAKRMHRVGSVGRLEDDGGSSVQLLKRCLAKTAGLAVVVFSITKFDPPHIIRETLYALGLYTFLGFLFDGPASLLTACIGLRIAPHFNAPYASPSMSSFWGSRWNLTASNTLRFLIYDPICDGRLVAVKSGRLPARASQELRLVGMLSCFLVSGAIHEVMYWYCQGYMTGLWLMFFTLQGPLILIEMGVRRFLRKNELWFPHWLKVVTTLVLLMGVGHVLFFPPAIEGGLADRVVTSIQESFSLVYARILDSQLAKSWQK